MAALSVVRVLSGSVSVGSGDTLKTVSLPATVKRDKTIVLFGQSVDSSPNWGRLMFECWLNDDGLGNADTLSFERNGSDTVDLTWHLIEFGAGVTVHWERFSTGASWGTTYTHALPTAPAGRTLLIPSFQHSQGNKEADRAATRFRLISGPAIELTRGANDSTAHGCTVQVAVFDADSGVSVQQVDFALNNTTTNTQSISTVTPGQTSVFATSHNNVFNIEDWIFAVKLDSLTATSLTMYNGRNNAAVSVTGTAFVVDWGTGVAVQRGTYTASSVTATSINVTISTVDPAYTVADVAGAGTWWFQHNGVNSTMWQNRMMRAEIAGATTLTLYRGASTSADQDQGWQVIDFSGIAGGGGGTDYVIEAEPSVIEARGGDANLLMDRRLAAEAGAISVVAAEASLRRGYVIAARSGLIKVVGIEAVLDYTPTGSDYVLTAETGFITVNRGVATLRWGHVLAGGAGTVNVVGGVATLRRGWSFKLEGGSIALTGGDLSFSRTYAVKAEPAHIRAVGMVATLRYSGQKLWTVIPSVTTNWAIEPRDESTWKIE